MPQLEPSIISDLTARAERFLVKSGGYDELEFLDAGGSAAVYRFVRAKMVRALKAFSPALLAGLSGDAERRRLDIQRRLIGHKCASLVQTYRVEEAEGTAFIEMEFIEWPQLAKSLVIVPDSEIGSLISQLIKAVQFLDSLNIVHRDIKPENIHISPDFKQLKLLDLGVAREFDSPDANDACITDQGNRRPFLATAQYSSPEYLFRLDEPTAKLWKGLNIYQVGAVLHDLIKKEPLFNYEVSLGNRWLVARAVLTKIPSFADTAPERLLQLKALASRCLTKELNTRLDLVDWEDFLLDGASEPVRVLQGRLAKGTVSARRRAQESSAARLDFERGEFIKRFSDRIRCELIHICGTQLPLTMKSPALGEPTEIKYVLTVDGQLSLECYVGVSWQQGVYERTANLGVGAQIVCSGRCNAIPSLTTKIVGVATIQEAEDEATTLVTTELARLVCLALDSIEGEQNTATLHGMNFQRA